MAQRRALLEGLGDTLKVDPDKAEEFVFGKKAKANPATETPVEKPGPPIVQPQQEKGQGPVTATISRIGLTTRIRSDFAAALKRASLERQLQGIKPNTLQDILEEALKPWLHTNGYLN
jgi:hypothetical protein